MRFTIINTVAVNGGDEALLRATISSLSSRWPNCKFYVLGNNPELSNKHIKDINFYWDWEYAFMNPSTKGPNIYFRVSNKIRKILKNFGVSYLSFLSRCFSSYRERKVYRIFKETDHFIKM